MSARLTLSFAVMALLSSCVALAPTAPPTHVLPHAHLFGATAVAFAPSGGLLASAGYRGEVALWRMPAGERVATLSRHHAPVWRLAFLGDRLISGDEGGLVVVWDTATGAALASREVAPMQALTDAGDAVATGHRDGTVRLWRATDLAPVAETRLPSAVASMAWRANILAVATDDGRVTLFQRGLAQPRTLAAAGGAAHDLRFSADGSTLVGGGWFRLWIWQVSTGTVRSVPSEHHGLVTSVDLSPDGQRMASLGRHTDSAVRVWQWPDLAVERRYQAHELCGSMIRFSPDGRVLASSSDDESIRLYDLAAPYLPGAHTRAPKAGP